MSHEFEMGAEAMRAFRNLRANEVSQVRRALDILKIEPQGDSSEYQLMSQNPKQMIYRYRTTVAFIVYSVSKEEEKRVIVTNILPFKKKLTKEKSGALSDLKLS